MYLARIKISDRVNASILLVTSAFVLGTGCRIAAGITFFVGTPNTQEKCGGSDLDKSGDVSFTDFAILAQYWLEPNCATSDDCGGADLIHNNAVDMTDLMCLAQNWLCELSRILNVDLTIDNLWMYQNLPGATGSNLIANVSVTDDPLSNSSYSYQWEFVLPSDVSIEPDTVDGGGASDTFWTFAARSCDQPEGISDSGQVFTVKVTVTGSEHGNTGTAQAEFGIALLGDVDNDGSVDVADRSIVNTFYQTGSAERFSLRDCDMDCDGFVDLADRSITNAIYRGVLGQNQVSGSCPFR